MSGTEVDFGQELSHTHTSAESKRQTVRSVLEDPSWLTNKYIDHIWFENHTDATYHGKILTIQRSRNKPLAVSAAYWSTDEREEDAVDYRMNISQFITNYLLGDLIFLEMWLHLHGDAPAWRGMYSLSTWLTLLWSFWYLTRCALINFIFSLFKMATIIFIC